jgi:hypothetical protein
MDSLFRLGSGRLRSGNLIKQVTGNVTQLIVNEFWIKTTNLTKRVTATIKNSAGVALASIQLKYCIFEYSDGIPYNDQWMSVTSHGVTTTDINGIIDIIYTGSAPIGGLAYLAILHPHSLPTESMIWTVTIV